MIVVKQILFFFAGLAAYAIAYLVEGKDPKGPFSVVFIVGFAVLAVILSFRLRCPRCRQQVMFNRYGWYPRLQCPNCREWFEG